MPATGYASAEYAHALAGIGRPRRLPNCGGWLLELPIPGSPARDGAGCYPLFACAHWPGLEDDLAALTGELVSVVMVTDPFGGLAHEDLARSFPDLLVPFK